MGHQRPDKLRSLIERAALQDRIAEMAAEVAQEAERIGQTESANILWVLVRRSRVNAMTLRARTYGFTR
jgi:hypothetical protein